MTVAISAPVSTGPQWDYGYVEADLYLDARQPSWGAWERRGHVRAQGPKLIQVSRAFTEAWDRLAAVYGFTPVLATKPFVEPKGGEASC